jgi:hypothetical protein
LGIAGRPFQVAAIRRRAERLIQADDQCPHPRSAGARTRLRDWPGSSGCTVKFLAMPCSPAPCSKPAVHGLNSRRTSIWIPYNQRVPWRQVESCFPRRCTHWQRASY